MSSKKEMLTTTLINLIQATEENEIKTSEQFLQKLVNELHMKNIINLENYTKLIKTKDYQELSKKGAELLMKEIKELEQPTIGLATGSTPEGLYKELIKYHQEENYSFKNVKSFNLDEYIGLAEEDENSYHYYM